MTNRAFSLVCLDVCGTPSLRRIQGILHALGYREAHPIASPGDYSYIHTDGAPGWQDWMYEVTLAELPDHPKAEVLALVLAQERRG